MTKPTTCRSCRCWTIQRRVPGKCQIITCIQPASKAPRPHLSIRLSKITIRRTFCTTITAACHAQGKSLRIFLQRLSSELDNVLLNLWDLRLLAVCSTACFASRQQASMPRLWQQRSTPFTWFTSAHRPHFLLQRTDFKAIVFACRYLRMRSACKPLQPVFLQVVQRSSKDPGIPVWIGHDWTQCLSLRKVCSQPATGCNDPDFQRQMRESSSASHGGSFS